MPGGSEWSDYYEQDWDSERDGAGGTVPAGVEEGRRGEEATAAGQDDEEAADELVDDGDALGAAASSDQ